MLLLLSPAKSLDFDTPAPGFNGLQPELLEHAIALNRTLRSLNPEQLAALMHISPKLSVLNFERNLNWQPPFTPENAKAAIFAFTGDVYTGLNVNSWSESDLFYAQDHLRILSGLYGLLRPLDLMQPYRLEMGTALPHGSTKTLYEFWGNTLTERLNSLLSNDKNPAVLNLASVEYFKAIRPHKLKADIVSPVFRDYKNGQYKIISFFAKQARGMMASWVIRNRIESPADLKDFNAGGYCYNNELSTATTPVFLRKQA